MVKINRIWKNNLNGFNSLPDALHSDAGEKNTITSVPLKDPFGHSYLSSALIQSLNQQQKEFCQEFPTEVI